ncbi:hypothetical protein DH2020_043683 [Rehmannia glutinosa]|uniref:Uncharacterized protein n=2 Tax=Rehmannia glutinosa TaxID=99300 RepID=A0ABR0UIX5_REHGL
MERFFRKQGMKGNSYKFLFGDMKEANLMYEKVYSKPIGVNDDILPRLMPNILDTVEKYGNYSFMWSGPRPRVFFLDPNLLKEVLSDFRKYHKSFKVINPIARMLVTGLASMEGDEWTKSRSKMNPAFQMNKLKPMLPAIKVCCEDMLREWKEMTSKGGGKSVIDVLPYLEVYTSSVLAQLMFSSTYTPHIKQTFYKLSELEKLGKLATDTFALPGQKYFPTKKNRRAKEIDKFVRDSFISMTNERLEKRKAGEDNGGINQDLLDIFIGELYDNDENLKDRDRRRIIEDVIAQCKIFFFAGFGSSSNVLCWTMIMLSVHKNWQVRAREEVVKVLGNKNEITSNDLGQLKVVTMIVNEMLRLYPPTMEFSRVVEEETTLGNYVIPKDTLITCPILLLNRSTKIWGEDAKEFNPERFAEGVVKATKGPTPYLPFGWGPRICIAQNFAILEIKLFLALLLLNFSFQLSPDYKHAPHVDFTIHPQYGALSC